MAKKYLLYIHDDKFQNEPQKSKLVNLLLEGYYQPVEHGPFDNGKPTKALQPKINERLQECERHHVPSNLCKHLH